MRFRQLKASEIECRVAQIKQNGLSLLLYKDARCDMRILDEEYGAEFWKRDNKEIKGNVYCGVSLYINLGDNDTPDRQWVTKWDAGAESYTEKVKGEASDSFKRACFNWGIGRELYTAPFIWIKPRDEKEFIKRNEKFTTYTKFNVAKIEYEDDIISHLIIVDDTGATRYRFGTSKEKAQQETYEALLKLDVSIRDLEKWLDYYKVSYGEDMDRGAICKLFSEEQAQFVIDRFKKRGEH